MQTIVTVTFVRSPQNVKCPLLSNHLINPGSVYGLRGNSAINFSTPYTLFVLAV